MKQRELAPGISAKIAWGEKLMLSLVILAPDSVVPEHSHVHEQMGMLISGTMELSMEGKQVRLSGNEMYLVPGGMRHSAKAGPEGAVALDAFAPPREEYKRRPGPSSRLARSAVPPGQKT
jgi:quercetin dioxygenase-like cupin family protein